MKLIVLTLVLALVLTAGAAVADPGYVRVSGSVNYCGVSGIGSPYPGYAMTIGLFNGWSNVPYRTFTVTSGTNGTFTATVFDEAPFFVARLDPNDGSPLEQFYLRYNENPWQWYRQFCVTKDFGIDPNDPGDGGDGDKSADEPAVQGWGALKAQYR